MTIKTFILPAIISVAMIACQSAPAGDKAETTQSQDVSSAAGQVVAIDTTTSNIAWIGTKPVGQHDGTLGIRHGEFVLQNGHITGGNFVIDMHTLLNKDLDGEWKEKLEGHLKGADFFDVARYPEAVFTITSVQPFDSTTQKSLLPGATHLISGNLKLKDSTKNITFPAQVTKTGNGLAAKANFNIDRTNWGISYGNDQSLKDNFIRPEVNIQLDLKAQN